MAGIAHIVDIPLADDPYYTEIVTLEGNTYVLDFRFNERAGSWHMDVKSEEGVYYVAGLRLVPNFPIDYNHRINDLSGYFVLAQKGVGAPTQFADNPEQISEYFNLHYHVVVEE